MGTQKNTSSNRIAAGLGLFVLLMSAPAFAQVKKPAAPMPAQGDAINLKPVTTGNDKVDITDLENKYWAPKDTDFSVVQNRTFSKEKHFFIQPEWGTPINDPWSQGNIYGLTANYFWSERMGVQFTYLNANLSNNDATDFLKSHFSSGVQPDHGQLSSYWGVGYNVVPFYAKMSFWGKKIIYFDMAITPTLGMTNYSQLTDQGNHTKSSLTYGLDLTQYFFFTRWLAIRVDLKNQWHHEDVVRFHGNGSTTFTGEKVQDKTIHDSLFLVGPAFYF